MLEKIILSISAVIGIILLLAIILTLPTYFLWNWLMPIIFGLPKLTLWQALGMTLLSGIIFKDTSSNKK